MVKKFQCSAPLTVTGVDVTEQTSKRTGVDFQMVTVRFDGNLRITSFASDERNFDLLSRMAAGDSFMLSFDGMNVYIPARGESTPSGGEAEPTQTRQPATPQITLEGWSINWDTFKEAEYSAPEKAVLDRKQKEVRKVIRKASTSSLRQEEMTGTDEDSSVSDEDFA